MTRSKAMLTIDVAVNSHLHSQLHSYGIFALTPSCECMRDLVRVLGAANNAWDKSVEETGAGLRRIDVSVGLCKQLCFEKEC